MQRGQAEPEHARREVVREHHAGSPGRSRSCRPPSFGSAEAGSRRRRVQRDRDHAGQDHQEREQHLRQRRDERRAPRRGHRVGRHRALHDEEVGAPVAERQHEAEAHHQPEPLDAHRVGAGAAQCSPTSACRRPVRSRRGRDRSQLRVRPDQPPTSFSPRNTSGTKPSDDQEELQHLVVDRRRQPAEEDVDEHDRPPRARRDTWKFQPSSRLQQLRHRVHRDAGGEHRHARRTRSR